MPEHVPILETARLRLVRLGRQDAPELQAAFPRWEIVRYLSSGVPWPYPPDGALTYIKGHVEPAMATGTHWHWCIRPREEPQPLIGIMSLMEGEDNNRGFWLSPEWQGRGLMTEACVAVNDFWFETLGKEALRIPKAIANQRSRRISERMGMRVIGKRQQDYVSGRLETEVWEITREEWRQWRAKSREDMA